MTLDPTLQQAAKGLVAATAPYNSAPGVEALETGLTLVPRDAPVPSDPELVGYEPVVYNPQDRIVSVVASAA